jgi:Tfp pilus assembly protein PilP
MPGLIAPELQRRKEALEAYPLDCMVMVGSVTRAGSRWLLLKVDNLLYQVRLGNYLGQNYGRIQKIGEPKSYCEKLCRIQRANGLNAMPHCSCKRGRNELPDTGGPARGLSNGLWDYC